MQLHGPPRLAGILRGLASAGGPIQDAWEDRSRYVQGRGRTRLKGKRRLWPSWSFQLVVTGAEWLAWRSDLEGDADGEFDWSPRTRAEDDPAWLLEHVYRARCVSDLPALSELRRTFAATGDDAYVVDVEIEGVEPYQSRPDTASGYFSIAEAGGVRTLSAYQGATIVRDAESHPPQEVALRDGSTATIRTLVLGPPATVTRYVRRDGGTLQLTTRSDA